MNSRNPMSGGIAAFVVAFVLMLSLASATDYSSCPKNTKVENAWWDAGECEGGIYDHGSLYFRWDDAPFTNDTVDVKEATLTISAVSQGTNLVAYIWTGSYWYGLRTGTLDFRGDYVYDISYIPGAYMDGSVRIKLYNRGSETLNVDSIKLDVKYESKLREVTLDVRDCDTNKRLDDVEVTTDGSTYYTDNGLATVELVKGKSYLMEFQADDYKDTKRSVYVHDDTDLDVCMERDVRHGVDVRKLDVDEDLITFTIENTGNVDEDISYSVYVDNNEIFKNTVFLYTDEDEDITGSYYFQPGKHSVRAHAKAGNYADSQTITYCVEGVTDNTVCSAGKLLRETIKSGCVSYWEQVGTCEGGTDGGEGGDTATCEISITSLNYANDMASGETEILKAKIANGGPDDASVTARLYVDGRYTSVKKTDLGDGESGEVEFRFTMEKGTHTAKIEATACGGAKDEASATIQVSGPKLEPGVPEGPDVEVSPEIKGVSEIFIETASSLETTEFEAATLKITVYPPTEKYTVSVTGVDQEWLDYPHSVNSLKNRDFYVLVSPEKAGNYTLRIRVWLGDEPGDIYDEEIVKLSVAAKAPYDHDEGGEGDGLTGMFVQENSALVGLVIALSLIAAVLMMVFTRMYMIDHHRPGSAITAYEANQIRRAAVDDEIDTHTSGYQSGSYF